MFQQNLQYSPRFTPVSMLKKIAVRQLLRAVVLTVSCWACGASAEWIVHKDTAMTTEIRLAFWHEDKPVADQLVVDAMDEFHRIDQLYSSYDPQSLLSSVNANAYPGPLKVPQEMMDLLRRSRALSELTAGAFDITFNSVGYQYDFRANKRPNDTQLSDTLSLIDYRHIELDEANLTVRFTRKGVRIGLGGIAKGFAVERVAAIFRRAGVTAAQITAGGDTRFIGDHDGRPWTIGVQDPRDLEALAAIIPVVDEAVSTSGDYARYFIEEGVRYHHIIDPGTGKSSSKVRSATVIGPDGVVTDALSTGIFVLGIRDGIALINRTDGYEAVLIDGDGALHYSQAFSLQ